MTTNENNQNGEAAAKGEGEGTQSVSDKIELSKTEYDELQKIKVEHGTFKRDLKDARKALEDTKKGPETPKETKPEDSSLLKKAFLRASGLSDREEQDLALETAKKWYDGDIEKLLEDPDWSPKLEKHRAAKSNAVATSNVRGGGGTSEAKNTAAYWKTKGEPPTPSDVPDRKTRQKIVREMLAGAGNKGTKFYNE